MPELPSGTVTFLFTDIEGSTRLWEQDRQAMETAVARHLALLDQAIGSHNGVHFKTIGDAVQAAFPTAPDAVTAALAAQRALLQEAWPERIGPVRVRIALHTAAATPQDGDYLAPGLNRLARLAAAGHGGQVLLSLATQDLARDALPPGATLRDLGEHPLRDLYRPEHVFQLLHPDLPADFPPIRTLATRPNNLPLQQTPFLGREEQVRQVVELLRREEVRLLTITGPGGVGKTRLALQAAADLLDAFPDGVWFVDLSVMTDPSQILPAMADVLGIRDEGSELTERLVSVIGEKRLLLVLDNFERVIDATQLVSNLLAKVPGLKVLVTSRTPLHAYGEQEYPLAPLPLPDPTSPLSVERLSQYEAVRLFIARAQAVNPNFQVTGANAPAVAEICFRLDGLPLAIELAAALVKMLPPQALLKRLEKRLPLLTGGARTLPARQQTMRNAIAWGHDLLTPEEQTLFRRLAVFPGGCTIDAAEAVTNPEGTLDVFGAMASLVDKSLLRQEESIEGDPRFRMLETVREYAVELLTASADEELMHRSLLAYLLQFATDNDLDQSGVAFEERLARLAAEETNLRAALEWGLIHDPAMALALIARLDVFWWAHGRLAIGFDLHERILATKVGENSPDRAHALANAAWLAVNLSDFSRAQTLADAAFALAERLGEAQHAAFARFCQGDIAMSRGDGERATTLLQDALARFEAVGNMDGISDCLTDLGLHAMNQGDAAAAVSYFERAWAIGETHHGPRRQSIDLGNLAVARYFLGDHERAQELNTQTLALAEQAGSSYAKTMVLALDAMLAFTRGEIARAAGLSREAIALGWEFGDKWRLVPDLETAAAIMVAGNRAEAAARLFGAAEALREAIDAPMWVLLQPAYARHVAALHAALDTPTVTRLWAQGRRLPLVTAVHDAIETLAAISGNQPTNSAAASSAVDPCPSSF